MKTGYKLLSLIMFIVLTSGFAEEAKAGACEDNCHDEYRECTSSQPPTKPAILS